MTKQEKEQARALTVKQVSEAELELQTKMQRVDDEALRLAEAVVDEDTEKAAARYLTTHLNPLRAAVVSYWRSPKQSAHKTWKEICARETAMLGTIEQARQAINAALYDHRELVKLAREAAAKKAAQEAARQAAVVVEQEAKHLEAMGEPEAAAEVRAEGVLVPAPYVPPVELPKGTWVQERWHVIEAEIDMKALVKAVAAGEVPLDALSPNMTYLNQAARTLKRDLKWPGITVRREEDVKSRSLG